MNWYGICDGQNELRLENILCDVIFEIGAKSFPAHRVVLMARVQHFRNMFTADMREKKELTVQFDPQIIHPKFFNKFLRFVYTSRIVFNNENIRAIYKTADYFCFDELITLAKEYMLETLKVENVVLYRSIAAEFNFEKFKDKCEQFIIDNLSSDNIKSQLIHTLSFEEFQSFSIKVKEDGKFEDMFHYCIDWILHDETDRSELLFDLLEHVPFEWLSKRFIKETVSKHDIIMKDVDCLKLLFATLLTVSEPLSQDFFKENESQSESIYIIGGNDWEYYMRNGNFHPNKPEVISEYNTTTREWTGMTAMPSPLCYFSCAVIGNKIYICGGIDKQRNIDLNELTVFDIHTQTWTQLTPMKHARQRCATAVLNGYIYVAGGYNSIDANKVFAEVERYCVLTDCWEDVAPMANKRYDNELVALNGFLYSIGGWGEYQNLNIVERYNPRTNQWKRMSSPNQKYTEFGSAVLNGNIYIASSSSIGKEEDCFCEMYSPADNKWTEIPAPKESAYKRRLAVYKDKLYSIITSASFSRKIEDGRTVEFFDFQSRVWRLEPEMDVKRESHQIVVVKKSNTLGLDDEFQATN